MTNKWLLALRIPMILVPNVFFFFFSKKATRPTLDLHTRFPEDTEYGLFFSVDSGQRTRNNH